jgi:hypothetical protein
VIPITVRFRGIFFCFFSPSLRDWLNRNPLSALADYQYTPELKHPINVLARDMRSLNCQSLHPTKPVTWFLTQYFSHHGMDSRGDSEVWIRGRN